MRLNNLSLLLSFNLHLLKLLLPIGQDFLNIIIIISFHQVLLRVYNLRRPAHNDLFIFLLTQLSRMHLPPRLNDQLVQLQLDGLSL